jgi:DinB superfamily
MDLQKFLLDAHSDLRSRLFGSVIGHVPVERWHDQADGGGSSLTWLLLHTARHQDLALTTVIRNKQPIFFAHRDALGLAESGPAAGLSEKEDPAVSAAVPADALLDYVNAVFAAVRRWLQRLSAMALATVPDAGRRLTRQALLDPSEVGWLYAMWEGHTVEWFVQWPILGHGQSHVGEAISVRNRLGLSPF